MIKKTQIPKNGTAVLLDVGHTDLSRPAYTDKISSMLGSPHGTHLDLPNNSTSLRHFIQMGRSFILSKFAAVSGIDNRAEFYALWLLMKIAVERRIEIL